MYRDDLRLHPPRALARTEIPGDGVDGRLVVLVDDVLFSGRTIRAALDALATSAARARSSSRSSSTAATANCPIRADYVGKNLPTSLRETVKVQLAEEDGRDTVLLGAAADRPGGEQQPPRVTAPYAAPPRRPLPPARMPVTSSTPRTALRSLHQMQRHLISAADLTRDDAVLILDTAEEMARVADRPIKKLPTLRGRTVVNLFFEDSTRTRISFEAAAKRLSADVINFSAKGSSVSKGESLKDTALTLEAMGADAVVIRHRASGAPYRLATSGWIDGAVVNAGDGTHEHPTQALLDAFTMRRRLVGGDAGIGRDLAGRRITIVGDILHSRVARSNVHLLHTLGAEVTLVAPPTLVPIGVEHLALRGRRTTSTRVAAQVRRGDDAARAARADERRLLPDRARVRPPLRPGRRPDGADARARHRDAPRPDEPRHGDHRRGRRLRPAAPPSSRSPTASRIRMAVLYLLLGGAEPAVPTAPTPPSAAPRRTQLTA